jgi:hypothetical protein
MSSRLPYREPSAFIDYVQLHERIWGLQNYPNRPSLAAILQARVVALWYPLDADQQKKGGSGDEPRFIITLHDDFDAVQEYVSRIVFRLQVAVPKQRLWKIFSGGKEVRVTGVKITLSEK